ALSAHASRRVAAILPVRGTRALARHHRRAERMLGRATRPERRALVRTQPALEHEAALALLRIACRECRKREPTRRVEVVILGPTPQAAARQHAEAAPVAVAHLVDLAHDTLGRAVAFTAHRAGVLVLHLAAARLELAEHHPDPFEQIDRLETGDHDGRPVA